MAKRERLLFRTHEPPFKKPEWAVGELIDVDGQLYRISRWAELRPVALARGGSVREWQVWGQAVSDKELKEAVDQAAARLLNEE